MNSIFSHQYEDQKAADESSELIFAVHTRIPLPLSETWLAFTEYTHLWWPSALKEEAASHIEFGEETLTEETEQGDHYILGEIKYFSTDDVIAVLPPENGLSGAFTDGLSFVFDQEDSQTTILEISSGLVKPREVGDSELGLTTEDLATAQILLGGFARFMRADISQEDLRL